jgi:hypothetical protein
MTFRKIRYEQDHPSKFGKKTRFEEEDRLQVFRLDNYVFSMPHVATRYKDRVNDSRANNMRAREICEILTHCIEEIGYPRLKEGTEYLLKVLLHRHSETDPNQQEIFGEYILPLKISRTHGGKIFVPTILEAKEREAYLIYNGNKNLGLR